MRISPFWRNLGILALVALVIVLLNLEVALASVGRLLQIAFILAIAVVAYFFWRDFGRREIETWPTHSARVFYGAAGLGIVDLGWFMLARPSGQNAFIFFVVAGVCLYVGIRTWRDQRSLV